MLLGIGLGLLLSSGHKASAQVKPVSGAVLLLAAIVLVLGPWWLRIARDLVVERQARARAEERADMAARVHDSVLQTLALIQRRASDPQQVIQLAGRRSGSCGAGCSTPGRPGPWTRRA